jgi:hypothetical protein
MAVRAFRKHGLLDRKQCYTMANFCVIILSSLKIIMPFMMYLRLLCWVCRLTGLVDLESVSCIIYTTKFAEIIAGLPKILHDLYAKIYLKVMFLFV